VYLSIDEIEMDQYKLTKHKNKSKQLYINSSMRLEVDFGLFANSLLSFGYVEKSGHGYPLGKKCLEGSTG
jgi:hypothetical protein